MTDPIFLQILRRAFIMIIRQIEKDPADDFKRVLAGALGKIVAYIEQPTTEMFYQYSVMRFTMCNRI
jgi:hypothetical protein